MNTFKLKYFVITFILSLLLFIITSPLLAIGVTEANIIGTILFQSFTMFLLTKWGNKCHPLFILLAILLGSSCIEILLRILYFEATLCSLSVFIGHEIAVLAGFIVWKVISKSKE